MMSIAKDKQNEIIDAFYSTSRYLDDLLDVDDIYLEQMVHSISC